MKKIIAIVVLAAMCIVMLTGCNMSIGFGNFSFKKVHVDTYHYSGCFTINKWHDSSSGIEVDTYEAGSMFLSEGTYMMLEGDKDCPFCADEDWSDIIGGIIH